MSEQRKLARPRQVTTAGVMGVAGSALVIISLFDSMSRLRTVEMRAAVEEFLAQPPGDGLGVSTAWVLDALHVLVLFNGAIAAVAAVLGIYVIQRNHAARIGFTIAAVLLVLTSPVSGGVLAMLVAFAATMLWSRPARDWFAGREPQSLPAPGERDTNDAGRPDPWMRQQHDPVPPAPQTGPVDPPPSEAPGSWSGHGAPSSEQPAPASYPFGTRPDPTWAPPAYGQRPSAPPTWAGGPTQNPERRPLTVTFAAALTWLFAGVTAFAFAIVVLMLVFGKDTLVEALRNDRQLASLNMNTNDLLSLLWVMSAVVLFWTVSALVLAVLAFRRVAWARITLAVSAGLSAVLALMAFPVGLVHALVGIAVIVLLFTGGANAWYARRPASYGPPPGGSQGGPYGGPYGGQQDGPYGEALPQPGPGYPGPAQQPPAPQPPAQQPPSGKPPVW